MTRNLLLFFLALTFIASTARAEISDALVLNAQKSIDAFTCSAIASFGGDEEYSQRLFSIGYNQGKAFLGGVNGNIPAADLGNKIPQVFADARGPNVDFALGRVYQENMDRTKSYFGQYAAADPAKMKTAALLKFEEMKCASIKEAKSIKIK